MSFGNTFIRSSGVGSSAPSGFSPVGGWSTTVTLVKGVDLVVALPSSVTVNDVTYFDPASGDWVGLDFTQAVAAPNAQITLHPIIDKVGAIIRVTAF